MKLERLVRIAADKTNFEGLDGYYNFCSEYLNFVQDGLQAVIVSRNETYYRFYQYKEDGNFNITRSINSNIMVAAEDFDETLRMFEHLLLHIQDVTAPVERECINRIVYTCQQAIGAALDALPSGKRILPGN